MNFVRQVLSDDAGRPSSKRVMGVLSGVVCLSLLVAHAFDAFEALDSAITAGAISFGYLGITGGEKLLGRNDRKPQ